MSKTQLYSIKKIIWKKEGGTEKAWVGKKYIGYSTKRGENKDGTKSVSEWIAESYMDYTHFVFKSNKDAKQFIVDSYNKYLKLFLKEGKY